MQNCLIFLVYIRVAWVHFLEIYGSGVLEKTSPNWQKTFRQTHQEKKEDENRPDYVRIDR